MRFAVTQLSQSVIGWGKSKTSSSSFFSTGDGSFRERDRAIWLNPLQLCKHLCENNHSMKWWSYGNNCPTRLSKSSHPVVDYDYDDDDEMRMTTVAAAANEHEANEVNPRKRWKTIFDEGRRMKLIISFLPRCGRVKEKKKKEKKKGHWMDSIIFIFFRRRCRSPHLSVYRCPFQPCPSTARETLNNFIFITASDPSKHVLLSWQLFLPLSPFFFFIFFLSLFSTLTLLYSSQFQLKHPVICVHFSIHCLSNCRRSLCPTRLEMIRIPPRDSVFDVGSHQPIFNFWICHCLRCYFNSIAYFISPPF